MSKLWMAALFGFCTLAFAAAPISIDFSSGTIGVKSAFAKHGADDVVPEPRPEPEPNDVPPHR